MDGKPEGRSETEPRSVPRLALSVRNLSKSFSGTRVLDRVDLDVRAGTVHALMGQNGSGKSTLIKVLSGYHVPDPGATVQVEGEQIDLVKGTSSADLRFLHQDLGLVHELSAVENLAVHAGFCRTRWGTYDRRAQESVTRNLLARFDARFDVRRLVGELAPIERTIVAAAAALAEWDGTRGVLVLDEPTALLPHHEVERLLEIVREIRVAGAGVLYVSHRMDEVFEVADEVSVLRDGRRVAHIAASKTSPADLAERMVGREVDRVERRRRRPPTGAKEVVRAKGLRGRELDGVDLVVREGEIVGVTGLPGSGASELVRQLANPGERSSAAQVSVAARGERRRASRDSHRGEAVALVPDDRLRFGVLPAMSVAENLSLANLDLVSRAGRMMPRLEREFTRRWVEELEIRCSSPASLVGTLSGGNQQKVVIGRCLATEPRLLLLMEPTAGVDVGTRHAIYALVDERSAHGMGVLVTSTDAADLVALCDRVLVLSRGRVVRELVGDEVSQERILASVEEVAA